MSQVADAYVVVRADMAKLDAQLSTLGGNLAHKLEDVGREASRGAMAGMATALMAGAEAAKGAFDSLVAKVTDFVKVAAESQQVGLRFNLMMNNMGEAIGYTREQMQQIAKDTQAMGSAGMEDVTKAMTALGKSGIIRGDNFKEALAVAQDLRVVLGTSLPDAAELLSHALANPEHAFRMLRQVGVPVTEQLRDELHRLADSGDIEGLQHKLLELFGAAAKGGSAMHMTSFDGVMERIGAKVNETKKIIGEAFFGAFEKVIPLVDKLLEKVQENRDVFERLGQAIADGLGKAVDFVTELVDSFTGLDDSTKDLIVNVGLFTAGILAAGAAFAVISAGVGVVVGLMSALLSPVVLVTAAVVGLLAYFVDWHEVISKLGTAFQNLGLTGNIAWVQIKLGASQMLDFFKDIWLALKAGFMAVWGAVEAGATAWWHNFKLHVMGGTGKMENIGDAMGKAFNEELNKGMSANFGGSQWTKDLKQEASALGKEFDRLSHVKREGAARPGKEKEKVNTDENTRSTDYGAKAVKIEFEGIASAWKKIQESLTGGAMVSLTKQIVENTGAQKSGISKIVDNTQAMADKMGQPQLARAAGGD